MRTRGGDDYAELAVHDSGKGIAEADLERVFEPFFTTKTEGIGMGLAISRSIAEAHGGPYLGENDPGGGAVFRLRLPTERGAAVRTVSGRLRLGRCPSYSVSASWNPRTSALGIFPVPPGLTMYCRSGCTCSHLVAWTM